MATVIAAGATFVGGLPTVRIVQQETDYTVYLIPRGGGRLQLPQFAAQPLPIASIGATHSNDRVGRMIDGDLLSRWDTAGPQDPTSAVTIDLGASKQVEGVETLIGGYLADFPRALTIEVSSDGTTWEVGVGGKAGADDLHLRARNTAHRARSAFRSTAPPATSGCGRPTPIPSSTGQSPSSTSTVRERRCRSRIPACTG